MPTDPTPIEDLDRSILNLCTSINAATYELLVMIREFDERAGFVEWGLNSSAEWLAWRCDLSMTTAREKVRVAHALKQLPLLSSASEVVHRFRSKRSSDTAVMVTHHPERYRTRRTSERQEHMLIPRMPEPPFS